MEALISKFGYLGILLGTFFEGEMTALLGGIFSKFGYLEIKRVILYAFFGTLCGDSSFFMIGRIFGRGFLEKRRFVSGRLETANRIIERHGAVIIFSLRFLSGLRTILLLLLGCSTLGLKRFFVVTAVNSGLWSLGVCLAGYLFAHVAFLFFHDLKRYEPLLLSVLVVLVFCLLLLVRSLARRRELGG